MLCFVSCGKDVKSNKSLTMVRDSIPSMHTYDVSTLVSDSGITRYKVTAPEWIVYDKVSQPYWLFPQGMHFDKFDENLKIFASADADSVIYFTNTEQWALFGNVHAMNTRGEKFDTDTLYVDQQVDRVHTDSKIKITQSEQIIDGIGFESNASLSKYTVRGINAIIPVNEDD